MCAFVSSASGRLFFCGVMDQTDLVVELDETVADVAEDCDEAQEDDNNEAEQLSALVDLIDARRAQGDFPLFQPRELLHSGSC